MARGERREGGKRGGLIQHSLSNATGVAVGGTFTVAVVVQRTTTVGHPGCLG